MRNNTFSLAVVVLLALAALYIVLPVDHPAWLERSLSRDPEAPRDLMDLKLGLDLRGGTQVLLESDLAEGVALPDGAMSTAKTIVENRVNGLGVAEAVVQNQGDNRIIVELPGVRNPDQAVETLRSTGQLEFVDPAGSTLAQGMIINTTNHPNAVQTAQEGGLVDPSSIPYPDRVFQTAMTGEVLRDAIAAPDQYGNWQINFGLTGEGSTTFFNYTSSHIGQPMAIVLDGHVLSAPTINAAISDNGVITGQFTQSEAESLAVQMRYGALPVPLKVVDIRTIGASLGQDSVSRSLRAAIVGMIAVVIYMLALYRLPGLLAAAALLCYIVFNLAIYKLIPVTLTLPGIAGFILSIGMAVDANILIFERFKEEMRAGRSLRLAVETGFSRAWPAIWDSNLSTLITCAVLFWFGNTFGASTVKGFAITLAVGVLLSMFSAVFVTRTFMRSLLAGTAQKSSTSRSLLGY
ncbi:MAG: protein translocase subunit SecD [Caldilineaceae bacterium]|nr:protein translocase subunit SecD [Caldilineaceae bacterium]